MFLHRRPSLLAFFLGIACLLSYGTLAVAAASGTLVAIYPPTAGTSTGQVIVAVNVYNVVNLQAVEFTVKYDSTIFHGVSVNFTKTIPGNCGCGFYFNQTFYDSAGVVTVSYTLLGTNFNGTGTLAFLTFKMVAYGISSLQLQKVTLVDKNFNSIPVTLLNGTIFALPSGGGGSRVILL